MSDVDLFAVVNDCEDYGVRSFLWEWSDTFLKYEWM
jgi:hypothetical protein